MSTETAKRTKQELAGPHGTFQFCEGPGEGVYRREEPMKIEGAGNRHKRG